MISVIIPAFNCEKTIAACVNSLLSRKPFNKEIEIIIVDDGSTDNTRTVAENLKKQHKHVKVLAQENKGAGAARNLGIEHAEGEYLWFIDGDDVVNENSINVISYELSRYKPQILVFNYKLFDESKNSYIANSNRDTNIYKSIPTGKTFDINQFPELLEAISYPWNKVYETSFVKEKKLAFSETIVNNDIFFNVASLSCANRIVKIDDALYTHFVNKVDGQLTQIFDKRRLNLIAVLKETENFLKNSTNISKDAFNKFQSFKLNVLDWAVLRTSGEIKEVFLNFLDEELIKLNPLDYIKVSSSKLFTQTLKNRVVKLGVPRSNLPISNDELMLSVVVPIYNVEPYLRIALQSIANQTLNERSFEVILVDDKSTDNSVKIAEEFTQKYSNFKLIKLEQNTPGGAGIPSNIGINAAKGKYVGFVDSDDYIVPTMFEDLLMAALNKDADVAICDFKIYYEKEKKEAPSNDQKTWQKVITSYVAKKDLRTIKSQLLSLSPVPWRKIYKKDFLDKNKIRYPEVDFFFEDNPLHWFVCTKLESIAFVNKPLIVHRIGRVGQTMEGKPEKLIGFETHAKLIKEFLDKNDSFENYKLDYLQWYLSQTSWVLPKLNGLRSQYLDTMKRLCKDYTFEDVKAARKIKIYKYARMFYNYGLIKGYPNIGRFMMNIVAPIVSFYLLVSKK